MNNPSKRYTAMAASCALIMSTFCSCGDNSTSSSGNYKKDEHRNNNSIVSEASQTADEEYAPEFTDSPRPSYPSGNEEYKEYIESGFKDPRAEPLSTFSADVDTASYSNIRRLIEDGSFVPEDAVRAEEFINYFDYDYPNPEEGRVFGDYVELADCPWNPANKLMMIGIQGRRLPENDAPPSNLVFLIDSSGSMASYDKLPLVQTAFS
ncbi:MAG: von Willebrand factor type A domain-containing protein, partial [Ruminococcus sp.]|nr:von Willebrand factor type A domain-containing protein [Ruminococcus sp.]